MIKVCVQVHGGASLLTFAVWAESIDQAVRLIEESHPDRAVRVVFPIDPEEFFVTKQSRAVRDELGGDSSPCEPVTRVL